MLKTNQTIHYHTVSVMFCIIIKSQQFPAYFQIFLKFQFFIYITKMICSLSQPFNKYFKYKNGLFVFCGGASENIW